MEKKAEELRKSYKKKKRVACKVLATRFTDDILIIGKVEKKHFEAMYYRLTIYLAEKWTDTRTN